MRDFLNQDLAIGDEVVIAINHGLSSGADLSTGIIVGFTPKRIKVDETFNHMGVPIKKVKLVSPRKLVKLGGIKHGQV